MTSVGVRPGAVIPALALASVLYVLAALATPSVATACTCAPWRPLLAYTWEPGYAVFSGWVAPRPRGEVVAAGADAIGYDFRVERWFWGAGAAPLVTIADVGGLACGLDLRGGEHVITVAWRHEEEPWMPTICAPWADADSPEGGRLLAEAAVTFGPGHAPSAAVAEDVADPIPFFGLGIAVGALLVTATALRRWRRSDSRAEP